MGASVEFYTCVGYEVVGRVEVDAGTRLTMLALPGEPEVSLELVHQPADGPVVPGGLHHLAVQVDDLARTRAELAAAGIEASEEAMPGGARGPRTAEVIDPDGYRLELVQWPLGHPTGMTREDFVDDATGTPTQERKEL